MHVFLSTLTRELSYALFRACMYIPKTVLKVSAHLHAVINRGKTSNSLLFHFFIFILFAFF